WKGACHVAKAKTNGAKSTGAPKGRGGSVMKPVHASAGGPPAVGAPQPPTDFKPLPGPEVKRLRKPVADQIASAESVANEIERSARYEDDFGPKALGAAAFAAALRTAGSWSTEAAHAETWAEFAANCAMIAWDNVLTAAERFKIDYKAALAHDASVSRRY